MTRRNFSFWRKNFQEETEKKSLLHKTTLLRHCVDSHETSHFGQKSFPFHCGSMQGSNLMSFIVDSAQIARKSGKQPQKAFQKPLAPSWKHSKFSKLTLSSLQRNFQFELISLKVILHTKAMVSHRFYVSCPLLAIDSLQHPRFEQFLCVHQRKNMMQSAFR